MKKNCFLLLLLLRACLVQTQDTCRIDKNVPCTSGPETDAYRLERCRLNVYHPENKGDFSTIVRFHGGGMEGGSEFVPRELTDQGFAVVAVSYRLNPKAKNPAYMENAAEAAAWTFRNTEKYSGRKDRIFVSGHSAGGYLMLVLVVDKKHIAVYGADADSVAAYPPVSRQIVIHFTIRKERGPPSGTPIVGEFAPINKAHKGTAPVVLTTGNKNLEMIDRYEKNTLLASVLKSIDSRKISLYELQGSDCGQVPDPACHLTVNYVKGFR